MNKTFEFSLNQWTPKLFQVFAKRQYSLQKFIADVIAGVTVGLVALPLAMAFAIASGVKPEQGIYTAIVAGFIISVFGGSQVQIGGPTGAFVIVVAGIIAHFGLVGLWMVTAMAGVILIIMGVSGFGSAVKYIPRPIIIGFTNGIALLIASTQLKDFLGLNVLKIPTDFLPKILFLIRNIHFTQWETLTLSTLSLVIILFWPRFNKRIPAYIVVLTLGTAAVLLFHLPVETIGSKFGGIPSGLPTFKVPDFSSQTILPLLPSALTVALLSSIESLLSAVVADSMTGDRHNSNMELIANGMANLVVPMVSGLPVTGAIARTATNIRSGGKTPVAGIIHAITLLIILFFAAPLAYHIPLATLAAILMVVAYRMGEWHEIKGIMHLSRADILVWLVTFLLTVFADLTMAVEIGMVLAALLYVYRVSHTTSVVNITEDFIQSVEQHTLLNRNIPDYVSILRIQGPFLFGATEKLLEASEDVSSLQSIVILRLRDMTAIDATGLHAIEAFFNRLTVAGKFLLLCGANAQPEYFILHSDFIHKLGSKNMLPHITSALQRAQQIHCEVD